MAQIQFYHVRAKRLISDYITQQVVANAHPLHTP